MRHSGSQGARWQGGLQKIHLRSLLNLVSGIQGSDFEGGMTVSGSHQPVRASFRPRLTTTPWRFGESEVMGKQPPPGQLFGSPVSAFGCPETGFGSSTSGQQSDR